MTDAWCQKQALDLRQDQALVCEKEMKLAPRIEVERG